MVKHYALLALLATMTACTSLAPPRNVPAPVESVGGTGTLPPVEEAGSGPGADINTGNSRPGLSDLRPPPPAGSESDNWAASPVGVQVSTALKERNYVKAGALIERELGISPRDAFLWLQLSSVRMLENRLDDAQGMAQRALSLARNKTMQDAANDQLRRIMAARS